MTVNIIFSQYVGSWLILLGNNIWVGSKKQKLEHQKRGMVPDLNAATKSLFVCLITVRQKKRQIASDMQ